MLATAATRLSPLFNRTELEPPSDGEVSFAPPPLEDVVAAAAAGVRTHPPVARLALVAPGSSADSGLVDLEELRTPAPPAVVHRAPPPLRPRLAVVARSSSDSGLVDLESLRHTGAPAEPAARSAPAESTVLSLSEPDHYLVATISADSAVTVPPPFGDVSAVAGRHDGRAFAAVMLASAAVTMWLTMLAVAG
jgi:hypothetical protein